MAARSVPSAVGRSAEVEVVSDDLQPLSPEEGVERFLKHREPSIRESSMRNARHRLSVFLEWCEHAEIENLNEMDGRKLSAFVA